MATGLRNESCCNMFAAFFAVARLPHMSRWGKFQTFLFCLLFAMEGRKEGRQAGREGGRKGGREGGREGGKKERTNERKQEQMPNAVVCACCAGPPAPRHFCSCAPVLTWLMRCLCLLLSVGEGGGKRGPARKTYSASKNGKNMVSNKYTHWPPFCCIKKFCGNRVNKTEASNWSGFNKSAQNKQSSKQPCRQVSF